MFLAQLFEWFAHNIYVSEMYRLSKKRSVNFHIITKTSCPSPCDVGLYGGLRVLTVDHPWSNQSLFLEHDDQTVYKAFINSKTLDQTPQCEDNSLADFVEIIMQFIWCLQIFNQQEAGNYLEPTYDWFKLQSNYVITNPEKTVCIN